MPLFARARSFLDTLLLKTRLDGEVEEELQTFVAELADRYVAAGMTPEVAWRAALLEVGGVEQVKENVREARIGHGLATLLADFRQAWRGLWRTPGFALVAILTLGLGIGATTAIFSLVDALLLSELPHRDGEQLVYVVQDRTASGYSRTPLAGPEIVDLRRHSRLFSGFGGIWANSAVLTGEDPEQLRIGLVTSDFFRVLGADPALGRTFGPEDEARGASPSILLSDALWRRRYGGDPALVGRTVQVDGKPTTVLGVMPAGFRVLLPPDAAVPDDLQAFLLLDASFTEWSRGQRFLRVVGRKKSGVSLEEARQEIAAIGRQIGREHAQYGADGLALAAFGLRADGVREARPLVLALFAGVGILLLVACVNVASLLVARAAARSRETALRVALGAGRGRLFCRHAVEGLLLGALGGLAGLVVGRVCLALLLALRPASLARIDTASLDPTVLAFTAGVALAWGFLLSLAPLAETRRTDLAGALRQSERAVSAGLPYRRRAALVVAQLALSVVLLVAAGLLVRAFLALARVDPGFSADGVLTFRLSLPWERFHSLEERQAFTAELRACLLALPGVTGAGGISHLPYDELPNWATPYRREGAAGAGDVASADTRAVTPGLLEALGARLVEGRFFTDADTPESVPVAIVDERLARRLWPGGRAVGRRFLGDPWTTGESPPPVALTVVGVVRHLRHRRPTQEVSEQLYFPVQQAPRNPMAYVVKSSTEAAAALTPRIRQVVAELAPGAPIYDVRPLSDYLSAARAARRFTMTLATAFAAAALGLAALGVYGVTAYAVALRRRELGLRLALGASRRQVVRLVMGESLRLAAVGLLLGLVGAGLAASLLASQLYGVTPADPPSYALAVTVLAVAVALAAWLPARRAARVHPLESLGEQ